MFAALLAKLCKFAFLAWFVGATCAAPPATAPTLGAINPVAGCRYSLDGSGVGSSDTSISLVSFTECISGNELSMSDFGEIGYATIEPGSQTVKEFISFTGVTQNGSNTKATLTGVTRGLNFISPYTASSSLRKSHSGGSTLIISNPPQLYNTFVSKFNDSSVTGTVTFATTAIPRLSGLGTWGAGSDEYLITKRYADALAIAGAPDASLSQKGIVEMATIAETAAGTSAGDTSARLVPDNSRFNTTSSATTTVPVTNTSGKLSQGFLDLTAPWAFTGGLSSSSSTFTGSVTSSATTAFSGAVSFNGSIGGTASFPGNLISASTTNVTVAATTTETNVLAVNVPANTLGTSSVIRGTAYFNPIDTNAATDTYTFKLKYGGTPLGTTTLLCAGFSAGNGCKGQIDFAVFGAGATNAQEGHMTSMFALPTQNINFLATGAPYATSTAAAAFTQGTSAIDSTSAQTLSLTVTPSVNSVNTTITMTRFFVWKSKQ